jgi:AcrR family transcriptional regulator
MTRASRPGRRNRHASTRSRGRESARPSRGASAHPPASARTPSPPGAQPPAAPARAGRRGGPRRGLDAGTTRAAVFAAAADAFSRRGFTGVVVDDIARAAGVNKAMIYYHFTDKLGLYREIVREMLDEAARRLGAIVAEHGPASEKIQRFVAGFIALADERPYLPPLMLREIAEGALRFDAEILSKMRHVFGLFARILEDGQRTGEFRAVHPVLAYMSVLGPVLVNAMRERVGAQPGRADLPMFALIPHDDLTRHMQRVALQMLRKE